MTIRSPQLDLLRGVAVLLVIAHHYPYYDFLHRVGWAGVDLFFVLSGFLISGLLFTDWKRNGRLSVGRFFVRRGLKIYPGFYVFLLITALPLVKMHGVRLFWNEFLFLQDYLPHFWGHTWSLAVEEHFYLLLPFILLILSKAAKPGETCFSWIPWLSSILIACCLIMRIIATHKGASIEEVLFPTHLRVDSLFAGVALGYIFHFRGDIFNQFSRQWLLPIGFLLLIPLFLFGEKLRTLSFVLTFNTLAFSALLWWVIPRTRIRCVLIEKIGVYSYSIYVWHLFITAIFRSHKPTLLTFWLNLAACCVCGFCAAQIIEFPVLKLRDKLVPRERRYVPTPLPEAMPLLLHT